MDNRFIHPAKEDCSHQETSKMTPLISICSSVFACYRGWEEYKNQIKETLQRETICPFCGALSVLSAFKREWLRFYSLLAAGRSTPLGTVPRQKLWCVDKSPGKVQIHLHYYDVTLFTSDLVPDLSVPRQWNVTLCPGSKINANNSFFVANIIR